LGNAVLFKTQSAALFGIDAYLVEVEVDLAQGGMGTFTTVGLPDAAVKESRERIKSAIKNCGFNFPTYQNITINLAPADIKKEGSGFDLPMALGILGATGRAPDCSRGQRTRGGGCGGCQRLRRAQPAAGGGPGERRRRRAADARRTGPDGGGER
jgi:hypothetical protein